GCRGKGAHQRSGLSVVILGVRPGRWPCAALRYRFLASRRQSKSPDRRSPHLLGTAVDPAAYPAEILGPWTDARGGHCDRVKRSGYAHEPPIATALRLRVDSAAVAGNFADGCARETGQPTWLRRHEMRVGIVALAVCLILALGVWGVFHLQVLVSGSVQDAFVSWLVDRFGMLGVTMWAISFFSTIPERVLLFFFCSVALGATFVLAHPLRSPVGRFLLPVGAAFFIFLGLYTAFHRGRPIAVAVSLALIVGITQWPS